MDHQAREYSLLLAQYKYSINLIATQNAFLSISNDIEDQAQSILYPNFIFTATGEDLDNIGTVIGLPRFPVEDTSTIFQLDVTPLDEGFHFGDVAWINYRLATDEEYQRGILSWIIVRNSVGNTNDLIYSLAALLGLDYSDIVVTDATAKAFILDLSPLDEGQIFGDNLYVQIDVNINKDLTVSDLSMLNYIAGNGSNLWAKVGGYIYNLIGT